MQYHTTARKAKGAVRQDEDEKRTRVLSVWRQYHITGRGAVRQDEADLEKPAHYLRARAKVHRKACTTSQQERQKVQ